MRKNRKNETIDYRMAIAEEIQEIARIFWEHVKADPSYISHGEMQMGIAVNRQMPAPDGKGK